jgi:hypothetical protein
MNIDSMHEAKSPFFHTWFYFIFEWNMLFNNLK